MGTIGQACHAGVLVAADPGVHALAADSVAFGDLGYGQLVHQHLHDRVVALFDHAELHQHAVPRLLATACGRRQQQARGRRCQISAETASTIS